MEFMALWSDSVFMEVYGVLGYSALAFGDLGVRG